MRPLLRRTPRLVGTSFVALMVFALLAPASPARAQGVTTSSVTGIVKDAQGAIVPGATVTAVHQPSGTTYEAVTQPNGRFSMPGMRVGGPYKISASLTGFTTDSKENITLSLGVTTDLEFTLKVASLAEEVTVVAVADPVLTADRTGAATAVTREALASVPTITGRLDSVSRLTPQYGGNMSFAGQDNRYNNITVDGSYFNNSFGLAGTPGERTGVAPISLAAIEQVQVAVAPYDVRQGNFVGAGVNTVTRSGTNSFSGSVYRQFRNESMVGTNAAGQTFNPGTFTFANTGFWASGPILKNRLFFFFNYEKEELTQPGTTFVANTGGQPVAGNVTRVLASDLDNLSAFLKSKFNYDTGPYQGYDFKTPARRILPKIDFNLNDHNKIMFRYVRLDSSTDVLESNSSSLGNGNRRTNPQSLNFSNSNYSILENIHSSVGEWNSVIRNNMANDLIIGYTTNDESRGYKGTLFPLVDVLQEGNTYTSFGFEPFTPNNELRYKTFQVQNNFSWYRKSHSLTFGATLERYRSENVFFPGSQGVYVYNSLADYYTDANDALANPNRTTSPVTLKLFQVRWNNIPGQIKPLQPLKVTYAGAYAGDQWRPASNLTITGGVRFDVAKFAPTGFDNPLADQLTFRDENNQPVQYNTAKLPDPHILWSPRVGFNWDISGDRSWQLRGGTGVFTGPPAYVWISNQIGNTGVLTGFESLSNTNLRPFNPNPNAYHPTNVTGAPASSYELAVTDPDFRFPQVWRSDVGFDRRLPFGMTGTFEFMYNKDVNGIYYINANQTQPNATFAGADTRPRWVGSNRIYPQVQDNIVLKNGNQSRSWNISGSVTRPFRGGFFFKGGYSYGKAQDNVDPGSIAFGSWSANGIVFNPNRPGLGYSATSPGHRVFAAGTFRKEYFGFGGTTVSLFFEGFTDRSVNTSYMYTGDLNGDGNTNNDLLYIPRNISEMNFQTYTSGGVTFTAADQAQAWDTYIKNDAYLSKHRGEYAVRNAVFLPMVWRADLSVGQDVFFHVREQRHGFQVRVDILNLTNLLNSNWGVGQRLVTNQPLSVPSTSQGGPADAQGRAQYRLRAFNNQLITTPLQTSAGTNDVWRIQVSVRFAFNNIGLFQ